MVFGPGSLGFAHSNEEQIRLDDIADARRRVLVEMYREKW